MTTYYMRADGNDANTGLGTTAGTAWKTMAHAGSVMVAGDRLEIRSAGGTFFITGEHDVTLTGSVGNLITVTNFTAESPIFDGTGGTFGSTDAILSFTHNCAYADIGGFTIRNNAQGSALGRGLEIESSTTPKANHLTFRNITVHDVNERAFGGGGDNITWISCEWYNYALSNVGQALGGGGWAGGLSSFSYSDNTLPFGWTVQNSYGHDGWGETIITLRSGSQDAAAGGGSGFTVEDSVFENGFSVTVYMDKCHGTLVRRCVLLFNDATYQRSGRNTDGFKFSVEGTALHTSYGVNNLWIYNNICAGMRDNFSCFFDTAGAASTYKNVKFWHNSGHSNERGVRIEAIGAGGNLPSGCEVINNIIDGTMTTLNNSSAWTIKNNDWWNNGVPAIGGNASSFSLDPQFSAPSTTDTTGLGFAVPATSPCTNAGAAISQVTTDFIGTARSATTPTIGAFEAVTATGATNSFLTGTGTVGSTITVTGLGFMPIAVIFWWNGRTEAIDSAGDGTSRRGTGVAVTPTDRRATSTISVNGVNPTQTATRNTPNACVSLLLDTTTVDGELDLQSMDADGFTLVVDNAFATSYRIFYTAIGGDDFVNAKTGQDTVPLTAIPKSITGLGFQPDMVYLFATQNASTPPVTGVDSILSIGAAISASEQAVWCGGSNNAVTPAQTISYARTGECLALTNSGTSALNTHAVLTSLDADGFTLNFTEVPGATAPFFNYLAIKGGSYALGSLSTRTDTTPITVLTPGYTAIAGLLLSANRTESTSDTPTDNDSWSMGGFSGTSLRGAAGIIDIDNGASSHVVTAIDFDAVYVNIATGGTVVGVMDIDTIASGSVSFVMEDPDPSAMFVWYLLIGPDVVVPPTPGGGSGTPGSGVIGAPDTVYFIRINDAFGNPMPDVGALYGLQVAQTVGSVGSATFSIPGDYPIDYLKKDGVIEIWRHPQNGQPYLLFSKIWYLRQRTFSVIDGQRAWTLTAYDPNYLISDPQGQRGRIVAYAADTAYSSKSDFSDDMIKAIARENIGALATDADRDLSDFLSIQADQSGGPNISKSFSNRVLLPVFNEICQASIVAGTYLAWDIVCTQPPLNGSYQLELRTYLNQRGIDHRFTSNQPVLLGLDYGNLDDVTIDEDWTNEVNYARVGGKGEGELRIYVSGADATRIGESPYNRREAFGNFSNVSDPVSLADEVDTALRAGTPRPNYSGRINPTAQARFDVEWGYGDYLTAQVVGRSFDARADSLVIDYTAGGGEKVSAYLRGEDVIP